MIHCSWSIQKINTVEEERARARMSEREKLLLLKDSFQ
jgi:hypothetical protein